MTPSDCMRTVRAVRDILVAAYSASCINTTGPIAHRPSIAGSLYLLARLVSHFRRTLWRCGQLWPYVAMGSLDMCLHRDCIVMGHTAKTSHCVASMCAQNAIQSLLIIHIILSCQIYVGIDNVSLVLAVSCLTPSSYLWTYVHAADNVSDSENLQSNCRWCLPHGYKFGD